MQEVLQLIHQATEEHMNGNLDRSKQYIDEIKQIANQCDDYVEQGPLLLGLAYTLIQLEQFSEGIQIFEDARAIAIEQGEDAQVAFINQTIASLKGKHGTVSNSNLEAGSPRRIDDDTLVGVAMQSLINGLAEQNVISLVLEGDEDHCFHAESRALLQLVYTIGVSFTVIDATNEVFRKHVVEFTRATGVPSILMKSESGGLVTVDKEKLKEWQNQSSTPDGLNKVRSEFKNFCSEKTWDAIQITREELDITQVKLTALNARIEHSNRIRMFVNRIAREKAESLGHEVKANQDPISSLFKKANEKQVLFDSIMRDLNNALGGHIDDSVSISDLPPRGDFLDITVDKIVQYVEEVCPADGNCAKCPSKGDCQVHNGECSDVEDIVQALSKCGVGTAASTPKH